MSSVGRIPAGYEDDEDYISCKAQNLSIKIVPNITSCAALNGEDFTFTLNQDMETFFSNYRELWNSSYKRTPAAASSLKIVFRKESEPLLLALKFFAKCPGSNNLKNKGMATFILETICQLCLEDTDIGDACEDNTRMVAFNFVKTCGITSLCRAVMETYRLKKIKSLLVPKLKDMISQNLIKDAANWAMLLKVTDSFGIFEIVFPLILQDKIYLAEEYLNVAQDQRLPIVQFLDSLLDRQKTVQDICDPILSQYNYSDIKYNVLTYRVMSKLVARLAKKYNIDSQLTPNYNYTKACSYMHYLFHKYYVGEMSGDSWRELICDTAVTKELQLALVMKIVTGGDINEAVYWTKYYKLPLDECPNAVKNRIDEKQHANVESSRKKDTVDASLPTTSAAFPSKPSKCESSKYLTLDLPAEAIVLVNSKDQFVEMLTYLEKFSLIGFDSEWKPTVCNENIVSILQLATIKRVYLLDCLSPHLTDELWRRLGRQIFNNLEIMKLGFALHHDLRMLHKSLPLQLNLQTTVGYLDLADLWRRLKHTKIADSIFGHEMVAGESLCALAELCLGKKLDKSNQCSNWTNRPLRYDQIMYAALDAFCLLQIYGVLSERLQRNRFHIDQIVEDMKTSRTSYPLCKRSVTSENNGVENGDTTHTFTKNDNNVLSATNARFICDHMLIGLSHELRKLGINCTDVNKLNTNKIIKDVRREKRCVLSSHTRYNLFSRHLSKDQCIHIPNDICVNQVLHLIKCCRLQIDEQNLYTRCLHCNSNKFIWATSQDMLAMRFGRKEAESLLEKQRNTLAERTETPVKYETSEHMQNTKTTRSGRPIQFHHIKTNILTSKQTFYICDKCGNCTWDGEYNIDKRIWNVVTPTTANNMTTKTKK